MNAKHKPYEDLQLRDNLQKTWILPFAFFLTLFEDLYNYYSNQEESVQISENSRSDFSDSAMIILTPPII